MNKLIDLLLVSSLLALLTACHPDFTDGEMKGLLTVDKSQLGNAMLEVKDLDTGEYRFIHPGKKIIQFQERGLSKMDVIIMDSRRVKLARFTVPLKGFNEKANTFSLTMHETGHDWGLSGGRTPVLLRREFVAKRRNGSCALPGCASADCTGVRGVAWQVTDSRYDYQVNFVNEITGKNVGTFVATGERRTEVDLIELKQCTARAAVHSAEEAFE